jgi:AsmA-like protein
MKGIDVAHLLSAFPNARGKMTGKMEGEMKIAGEIEHSRHPLEGLHGSGHLMVRNGDVPSLELNANLMKLAHYNDLGPAKNDPSSFNFVSTDLELDHERITSKVIDIDGYGVDLDGSGSVSLSGSDELNYQGVAEIVSQQGFVTNLFARLAGGTYAERRQAVVSVSYRRDHRQPSISQGLQGKEGQLEKGPRVQAVGTIPTVRIRAYGSGEQLSGEG